MARQLLHSDFSEKQWKYLCIALGIGENHNDYPAEDIGLITVMSLPDLHIELLDDENKMSKEDMIKNIKDLLEKCDYPTPSELMVECSPVIGSVGNGLNQVIQLVEGFGIDTVLAVSYHRDQEVGEEYIAYEDLSEDVLYEIYMIMEKYYNEIF